MLGARWVVGLQRVAFSRILMPKSTNFHPVLQTLWANKIHSSPVVWAGSESKPDGQYAMIFTCDVCQTRSARTFSKLAYEEGVVLLRCAGCHNNHLVADNLGWFGDEKNVEEIAEGLGKQVQKGDSGTFEFIQSDKPLFTELCEKIHKRQAAKSSEQDH